MSLVESEIPTASEAKSLAEEAYVFGLPLICVALTRDVTTNVARPTGTHAPLNQFAHFRNFPAADNRDVVLFNLDTLYSMANLDLTREPMVLSVPEMGDRYWLMQVINAWNDVPHAPGTRTVGGKGGDFALTGPAWTGKLPEGLDELRVGTSMAVIGGRTYSTGPKDFAAVHRLQDQYRLTPLSHWGSDYTPPEKVAVRPGVDTRKPVNQQILDLPPEDFFNRLNALLQGNPPYPADAPLLERLARIEVRPGAEFRIDDFPEDIGRAIVEGMGAGRKAVAAGAAKIGKLVNGWQISLDMGRYGTRYDFRAASAFFGLGANLPEDAVYPISSTDGQGRPLQGANRYALRFPKGKLPPVHAFWSVTLYDIDGYFVPNPIDRRTLGDRSGLKQEDDGSLTLHIQSESPGPGKEGNWLPSPADQDFKLVMRLYSPGKEILSGSWQPPEIRRIPH